MAQIKQVGVGQHTTGTMDGVCYAIVNGRTIARRLPAMPAGMFQTPQAKKRQALFTLVNWHLKKHRRTIARTFSKSKHGTAANRYAAVNWQPLAAALDTLADTLAAGGEVTREQVEQAITAYATAHPTALLIALRDGYEEVRLAGPWPAKITLNAIAGDGTIVVLVEENGDTVTVTPNDDGTHAAEGNGTTPPDNGGGTTPPDNGGGTTPPDNGGGTTPPDNGSGGEVQPGDETGL